MKYFAILVIAAVAFTFVASASTKAGQEQCPDCDTDDPPKPFDCYCDEHETIIREAYILPDCLPDCHELKFCCRIAEPDAS